MNNKYTKLIRFAYFVPVIVLFLCFLTCIWLSVFSSCLYTSIVHYEHMNGYSELVIERVSKDDSGTYTCVAENSVGTIKSVGFVYVKGKATQIKFHLSFIGPRSGDLVVMSK